MNHFKNIFLILLLMVACIRCTEIYTPNISSDKEALVVEGLITDDAGPFTIKLSMAKPLPFDSVSATRYIVHGATLTVTDNENNTYTLTESIDGNYIMPLNFKAIIGNSYKLNIKTKDGNNYESNQEKLLPPQTYDRIRSIYSTESYLNEKNELQNIEGTDIRVDLFNSLIKSDSIPSCRFESNITLQYWYTYRERDINGNEIMSWHWDNFGWKTYKLNSITNITEEKTTIYSPLINHSLGFMPFESSSYGLDIPKPQIIYYLKVNQYTMNNDSYRFYKEANNQLSASGKIFDPITSQLYGNLKCVNDPSKIILGLFEVSSVKKHAFLVEKSSITSKEGLLTEVAVMDVPIMQAKNFTYGDFQYKVWDADSEKPVNDTLYIPIPLPAWWSHN